MEKVERITKIPNQYLYSRKVEDTKPANKEKSEKDMFDDIFNTELARLKSV